MLWSVYSKQHTHKTPGNTNNYSIISYKSDITRKTPLVTIIIIIVLYKFVFFS